jgi:hypothetical protein
MNNTTSFFLRGCDFLAPLVDPAENFGAGELTGPMGLLFFVSVQGTEGGTYRFPPRTERSANSR